MVDLKFVSGYDGPKKGAKLPVESFTYKLQLVAPGREGAVYGALKRNDDTMCVIPCNSQEEFDWLQKRIISVRVVRHESRPA